MSVRSGQSITTTFTTSVFSTGAAANADSLPTGTLYVNGTADAASVTVTNVTTGLYKAAVTLPTLAVGDVVSLVIAATVSTVAAKGKVWEDTKDVVIDAAGLVDANVVKVGPTGSGTPQTARDLGLALPAVAPNADGGLPILSVSGTTLDYTVSVVTTNSDMRGTDGANTSIPPTSDAIAEAIGTRVPSQSGSRDYDYFVQGGPPEIEFSADGLSLTVYSVTGAILSAPTTTRLPTTVGGIRSISIAGTGT